MDILTGNHIFGNFGSLYLSHQTHQCSNFFMVVAYLLDYKFSKVEEKLL